MAETVWNKKLLAVSLALGVGAAILFYVYEWIEDVRASKNVVQVLKWKANLPAGEEVSQNDIDVFEIPKESYLDGVLMNNSADRNLVIGSRLGRNVERGDWIRYSDVRKGRVDLPSKRLRIGDYVAFPLSVDPNYTPGDMLNVGDKVGLIGLISVAGKGPQAYMLIDNVRVVMVGGRSETIEDSFSNPRRRRMDPSMSVYRRLALEVDKQTALQLAELLPRVHNDRKWVVLRNPDEPSKPTDGKINPRLLKVLQEPLPPVTAIPE